MLVLHYPWSSLVLLLFSSSLQLIMVHSDLVLMSQFCVDTSGNYKPNSLFAENLNEVLANLASEAELTGFYNTSIGFKQDQVNALYMCRGDISSTTCYSCVTTATTEILALCPNQKEAIIWYDLCTLRYSSRNFFSISETSPLAYWNSTEKILSNVVQFDQFVTNNFVSMANETAFNPLTRMFVSKEAISGSLDVYFLTQCTQDLTPSGCYLCLKNGIFDLQYYNANGRDGAMILLPSCILQYSVSLFYYTAPPPPPLLSTAAAPPSFLHPAPPPLHSTIQALPSPDPSGTAATNTTNHGNSVSSKNHVIIIAIIIASVAATVMLCSSLLFYFLRRKPNDAPKLGDDHNDNASLEFDLGTIRAATNNFSIADALGEGGFGTVYKGVLPSSGQEIAVKRLSKNSGQGDKEFKNEVKLVAKLQHRNLVRLLGFCISKEEKLLIYEFVPNASLDRFLFDPIGRSHLNWETRYKIIVGIARGLLYLHEDSRLKIVHRDLKSSNILLDSDLCPKISDFGMARLVGMDQTHCETTKIAGTFGYMAPEYVLHGQFSVKSDVYSYGILLLEIVSGQRNGSTLHQEEYAQDLVRNAWEHWTQETPLEFLDSNLRDCCSSSEVIRSIHTGLSCVQDDPAFRPSMVSVIHSLQSESLTLPVLSAPTVLAKGFGSQTREYYQGRVLSSNSSI